MKLTATLLLSAVSCLAGPVASSRSRLAARVRPHFNQAVSTVRKTMLKAEEESSASIPEPALPTAGGTAPFGKFWDPASFTKDKPANLVRRYREAELTHGRVGMLGALGFLVQEKFHPLFGGDIDGPAVYHFEEIVKRAPTFWYPVLLAISIAELGRARIGWQDPFDGGSTFALREGYEPGNLGWDPLGLKPKNAGELETMQSKEINNGRLAMIGLAGMLAQELVDGKKILRLRSARVLHLWKKGRWFLYLIREENRPFG